MVAVLGMPVSCLGYGGIVLFFLFGSSSFQRRKLVLYLLLCARFKAFFLLLHL